jgi:hypothetical protein
VDRPLTIVDPVSGSTDKRSPAAIPTVSRHLAEWRRRAAADAPPNAPNAA